MRKLKIVLSICLLLSFLVGCEDNTKADASTIILSKDGKVTCVSVEDFSQPYYDQEELRLEIEDGINDYNSFAGNKNIVLNGIDVTNQIAKLTIQYQSVADYQNYTEQILFVGTIQEAMDEGYDFDVALTDATDTMKTIGKEDLQDMLDKHVIIAEEEVRIRSYSKILYYSSEAKLVDSKEVDTYNTNGLAYIVF